MKARLTQSNNDQEPSDIRRSDDVQLVRLPLDITDWSLLIYHHQHKWYISRSTGQITLNELLSRAPLLLFLLVWFLRFIDDLDFLVLTTAAASDWFLGSGFCPLDRD